MNCCVFREKYSDFADGLLPAQEESEAGLHLDACPACRRFDAALRAGLDVLRTLPNVGVSRGFSLRLRQRLRGEFAVRAPIVARWSGAVGALLLVATVGSIGWGLLKSRAGHHVRQGYAAATGNPPVLPLAVAGTTFSYPNPLHTSSDSRFDAFHPLNSILVTEQALPTAAQLGMRFDVPAVWGGP